MTLLAVAQRGEPILQLIAQEVNSSEINSAWLNAFVDALHATMLDKNGVGIAAPQVYVSKRIIIVASRPNPRYPDAPQMDAIVMINPKIIQASENMLLGEEGCLSVPGQRAEVSRAATIKVAYTTLQGESAQQSFEGFPARIVQHEIDHLDGILFVEKI